MYVYTLFYVRFTMTYLGYCILVDALQVLSLYMVYVIKQETTYCKIKYTWRHFIDFV